jgi:hypothetical protein
LWHNLGLAVERLVARLRSQWIPPTPEKEDTEVPAKPEGIRAQRVRERHAAVHALMAKGAGIGFIVGELRLDPKTVRKCMNAATQEELIGSPTPAFRAIQAFWSHVRAEGAGQRVGGW